MDNLINVFGISIGGTKCAVSYWTGKGEDWTFVWKKQIATLKRGYTPILAELCDIIDKSNVKPDKIGIICGGPLDAKRGIIQSPPNLHGWDDVHITEFFDKKYGVKSRLVNDADAGALAEWKFGAGKGAENMLFLTFGTGFGAGLIINGKLYSGTNGAAGEIGHVRLSKKGGVGYNKVGSVEGFVSGGGMAQTGQRVAMDFIAKYGKSDLSSMVYRLLSLE
jgi:glucokinase